MTVPLPSPFIAFHFTSVIGRQILLYPVYPRPAGISPQSSSISPGTRRYLFLSAESISGTPHDPSVAVSVALQEPAEQCDTTGRPWPDCFIRTSQPGGQLSVLLSGMRASKSLDRDIGNIVFHSHSTRAAEW